MLTQRLQRLDPSASARARARVGYKDLPAVSEPKNPNRATPKRESASSHNLFEMYRDAHLAGWLTISRPPCVPPILDRWPLFFDQAIPDC
jgi:hypothetical protein